MQYPWLLEGQKIFRVVIVVQLIIAIVIGLITDFFTSNEYFPVQNLAVSCKSGEAINIIQGIALGYLSCLVPIICFSFTICVCAKKIKTYKKL